jgi:hypothetical protein
MVSAIKEQLLSISGCFKVCSSCVPNPHSKIGGIPTNCALDGLSRKERKAEGKHGVVKLAFVTSFLLQEGMSLQDMLGGSTPDFWIIDDVNI